VRDTRQPSPSAPEQPECRTLLQRPLFRPRTEPSQRAKMAPLAKKRSWSRRRGSHRGDRRNGLPEWQSLEIKRRVERGELFDHPCLDEWYSSNCLSLSLRKEISSEFFSNRVFSLTQPLETGPLNVRPISTIRQHLLSASIDERWSGASPPGGCFFTTICEWVCAFCHPRAVHACIAHEPACRNQPRMSWMVTPRNASPIAL
jgi:hypothetical protein